MEKTLLEQLLERQDRGYKDFVAKLIPTLDPARIIGVRSPSLAELARIYLRENTDGAAAFLELLPHYYYEENLLHSVFISKTAELDQALQQVETFLPYIDNWAVCDSRKPAVFAKDPGAVEGRIREWLRSPEPYTQRYALGVLMSNYLGEHFRPEHLALAAAVESDEYYVRMMVAWYFATALAKQADAALPYIETGRLAKWTHNKTIQKAVESRRISPEMKDYLKSLRTSRRSGSNP